MNVGQKSDSIALSDKSFPNVYCNEEFGVLCHPGHPLAAVDTPKAADSCQKWGQNPLIIHLIKTNYDPRVTSGS